MAKAKKTETTAAAKDSTSASAPKKKATKAKAPAAPSSAPMIDTGLAAENAAKLVFAKVAPPTAPAMGGGAAKESASFKNLKASLNKPASGMSTFLDRTAGPGQKKSSQPMGGGKQVGRNQTFGADVNRTGVPRRTGG